MALDKIIASEEDGRYYLQNRNPANGSAILNPVTGMRGEWILVNNEQEVKAKIHRVRKAYEFWRTLTRKERGQYFRALQREIVKNSDAIATLISEENGKPMAECWGEILGLLQIVQFYRKKGLSDSKTFKGSGALNIFKKIKTSVTPASKGKEFGVAGAIIPWNYPFMIPLNIAVRSLFYGNTIVIKPSEQVPYSGEFSGYIAQKAWERAGFDKYCAESPISVVQGDGGVGKMLVDSLNKEEIDFLLFCGSSSAGRKIKQAVNNKNKLELLLGGKDPIILLEDCDLDIAVDVLTGGCLFNTGQSCSSIERVYIQESIADSVINSVLQKVAEIHTGYDPEDRSIDCGPIMNKRQFDILMDHINDAVDHGAQILFGGERLSGGIYDKGYYLEPTVLINVTHEMKIMTEETFGPIIPIMTAKTEEELIRLANDSRFGLTAIISTKDIEKGEKIAQRICAGTVYVNDVFWTALEPKVHWPGAKDSGNFIDEKTLFEDKVIAITKGNLIDKISLFWLKKGTLKAHVIKDLVKFGFLF